MSETSDTAFDAWFTEREGFSLRAERFDGDVAWLKAAFEAGQAAERERCAQIADGFAMLAEQKFSTAAKCGDGWGGITQSARLATSEFIASSIRSPDTMGDRSKI